ncbi:AAA family ATPase [Salisaeta longa]|uniref:AAA family ATPase n=1 Tax=Salisaeta longa TaxID=503170 RepID=UPI0003B392A0|nr:AAA family ATPase [Salisaeta longa]
MIQELYCKNFKIFRTATTVPLHRLTVVTGPNNSGKSTIIDLFRLLDTDEAHEGRLLYSLNFGSGDHRLRTFPELLNDPDAALEVGLKAFVRASLDDLQYCDGRGETDRYFSFALSDDVQVRSRFENVEERAFLKHRTISLHPPEASASQRVFRETHALTDPNPPPTKPTGNSRADRSATTDPEAPSDRESAEAMSDLSEHFPPPPTFATVSFGVDQGEGFIREGMKPPGLNRTMARKAHGAAAPNILRNHYHHKDRTTTWEIEPALFEMALAVLNHCSIIKPEGSARFSSDEIQGVCERPSSIPAPFYVPARGRRAFPVRSILPYIGDDTVAKVIDRNEVPDWVSPHHRDAWASAFEEVIGPLIEQIDLGLTLNALHIPTYRGRPKRFYGPNDALTPLLQRFQTFEIKAEEMEGDAKAEYIDKWLAAFELGSSFHVDTVGPDLYEAYVIRDGEKRYLADLGAGSAQLLPLIINFATQQASLVIVEEPEANLHPNLQAQLADFFVEMVDRGIQVVVETHSEYLTRRLQYLVARGACPPEHTGILYLRGEQDGETDNIEETPKIKEITIDTHGQLSQPLGPGFFDKATDLMMDLFKYGQEN